MRSVIRRSSRPLNRRRSGIRFLRFHLPEAKGTVVSQVIAATIEANLIKLDAKVGSSRKLARYLPFWA